MTVTKRDTEAGDVAAASGEDLLKKLGPITIELENHQTVMLKAASELHIPDDPGALIEAEKRAAARYAFWAYQTEVQMGRVRALQRKLEMKEGQGDTTFRTYIMEFCKWDVTETAVSGLKDIDPTIGTLRVALNRARKEYGILRVMKEALNHRCFALGRLVARMSDVQKG